MNANDAKSNVTANRRVSDAADNEWRVFMRIRPGGWRGEVVRISMFMFYFFFLFICLVMVMYDDRLGG